MNLTTLIKQKLSQWLPAIPRPIPSAPKPVVRTVARCNTPGQLRDLVEEVRTSTPDHPQQLASDIKRILHDLKNPIGSILGMLEIYELSNREAEAAIEEAASAAMQGLNQALAVLNGQQKLQTSLRLNTIVRQVASRFKQSSIRLELNSLPDLFGNEGEMDSLLNNLLKNAIEAEGIKGREQTVAVETWYEDDSHRIVCRVSDKGCGIPADLLPLLWEGNKTTKPHGSGAGMSIVKQIVDRYNGSVAVETQPGRGSAFTVSLPVAGTT